MQVEKCTCLYCGEELHPACSLGPGLVRVMHPCKAIQGEIITDFADSWPELVERMNTRAEEITSFYYTLTGVMHFVDKWLDGNDLKLNEVARAAKMREIILKIIETQQEKISALKAERDAAIAELKKENGCYSCKLVNECAEAFYHTDCKNWQWRGAEAKP